MGWVFCLVGWLIGLVGGLVGWVYCDNQPVEGRQQTISVCPRSIPSGGTEKLLRGRGAEAKADLVPLLSTSTCKRSRGRVLPVSPDCHGLSAWRCVLLASLLSLLLEKRHVHPTDPQTCQQPFLTVPEAASSWDCYSCSNLDYTWGEAGLGLVEDAPLSQGCAFPYQEPELGYVWRESSQSSERHEYRQQTRLAPCCT